jgi:dTDP-4-amino-4,6-dideoxygalactose transaminase
MKRRLFRDQQAPVAVRGGRENSKRSPVAHIPFNRVSLAGREFEYMQRAIEASHLSGDGMFTRQCQRALEQLLGVPKVFLTTSGTHALELTALLLEIQPGDEIIAPSFTFVSTVNAFVLRGARPVFADIRSDTLNLDEARVERLLSDRTRAIVVVHYAGVACEMDRILDLGARHGIPVLEDNAHGLFGRFRGRPLGTLGWMATLSFHETKNITCGEGGALILNDAALIERAEILREKGTNRARFFRGEVDKYTWVDVGSSYGLSEILAAFLLAQLERHEAIQASRRANWEAYYRDLEEWAEATGARLPVVPPQCEQSFHLFYVLLPSFADRQAFIKHLKAQQVDARFHYVPLHLSEMGRRFGAQRGDCRVTEDVSDRLVRLPLFRGLTAAEQARVVAAIETFH